MPVVLLSIHCLHAFRRTKAQVLGSHLSLFFFIIEKKLFHLRQWRNRKRNCFPATSSFRCSGKTPPMQPTPPKNLGDLFQFDELLLRCWFDRSIRMLLGKKCIVTGASSGIGSAVARYFIGEVLSFFSFFFFFWNLTSRSFSFFSPSTIGSSCCYDRTGRSKSFFFSFFFLIIFVLFLFFYLFTSPRDR